MVDWVAQGDLCNVERVFVLQGEQVGCGLTVLVVNAPGALVARVGGFYFTKYRRLDIAGQNSAKCSDFGAFSLHGDMIWVTPSNQPRTLPTQNWI